MDKTNDMIRTPVIGNDTKDHQHAHLLNTKPPLLAGFRKKLSQSPRSSTLAISPAVHQYNSHGFDTDTSFDSPIVGAPGGGDSLFMSPDRDSTKSGSASKESGKQNISQAERLRLWRHDAYLQHHYKTAEFIGDKVLSLTKDPNDAFWLAQVHYSTGQYARARQLLSEDRLSESVSCRYLAALCLTKMERWEEALQLVGDSNPFTSSVFHSVKSQDHGIKLEASMCYLRGQIYSNQNCFDKARDCYREAVLVDPKCFEAFDELVSNHLLSPEEEWDLLTSLQFNELDDNADFVKSLYTIRLSKYLHSDKISDAEALLAEDYSLDANGDILQSRADLLFLQCAFSECMAVCEKIMALDAYKLAALPNYVACLHELGGKNKLFLVAHQMADQHPDEPVTWLSVAMYYLSTNRISLARRYFSKASMMSPNFVQAWIGFAHTFAIEGEHEQAISAYSTAARLFLGSHLPSLYLGMQHLHLNNFNLAEEYLESSFNICKSDPLLLNEIGVTHYHKSNFSRAEAFFLDALRASEVIKSEPQAWLSIHANLGHVYRRTRQFAKSLEHFEDVLCSNPTDHNVQSAVGLVHLQMGNISEAINYFHKALSIVPADPVATDMLGRAMEENVKRGIGVIAPSSPDVSRINTSNIIIPGGAPKPLIFPDPDAPSSPSMFYHDDSHAGMDMSE